MTKKQILIIENDLIEENIPLFLKKNNFTVDLIKNSKDVLKHIINYKPDLIILNAKFSNSETFKLCDDIKTNKKLMHIPIILTIEFKTNKTNYDDIDKNDQKINADDFIFKPFEMEKLLEIIEYNI